MEKLGYEMTNDTIYEWRNNGGVIERKAHYQEKYETMFYKHSPKTSGELKKYCTMVESEFISAKSSLKIYIVSENPYGPDEIITVFPASHYKKIHKFMIKCSFKPKMRIGRYYGPFVYFKYDDSIKVIGIE